MTTSTVISSTDVHGTDVYGLEGEKVGHIDELMINKESGKVAYAIMRFGGFLGMGEEAHIIPWSKLQYSTDADGYTTEITEEQLKGAPGRVENWHGDRNWEKRTHDYYAAIPYW